MAWKTLGLVVARFFNYPKESGHLDCNNKDLPIIKREQKVKN